MKYSFNTYFENRSQMYLESTSDQDKEQLRVIIRNLIANNNTFFDKNHIDVGDKGNYWILNYMPGPRNEVNRLVRGLVVQKPAADFKDELALIRSFPFTRFFNQGEKEAAPVDFSNAEMMEKMDGTMVAVWFPSHDAKEPHFNTRKMLSTHQPDVDMLTTGFNGSVGSFLTEIKKYVLKLQFNVSDVEFTYVFEFIHEISTVLTKYKADKYGLYLIGGRNTATHAELSEVELDEVASRIGAFRARRYKAVNMSEIESAFQLAKTDTEDFEGFVFRDKTTGNRVKVKDPEYVRKHHMLGATSYKNLLYLYLDDEADEMMAYFPHIKTKIENIATAWEEYLKKSVESIYEWSLKGLGQKDLALTFLRGANKRYDNLVASAIMKLAARTKDKDEIEKYFKNSMMRLALGVRGAKDGQPKEILKLIGVIKNEEDADTPLEESVNAVKKLYIMRGLPGAGKSTLSSKLKGDGVVYSTDDYFYNDGKYEFIPGDLQRFHQMNVARTETAMKAGVSPIVVDNTHVKRYAAKPYVLLAQKYGYEIEVHETDTPWRFDVDELTKRNRHGVTRSAIQSMIDAWDTDFSIDSILNTVAPWEKKKLKQPIDNGEV